MSPLDVAKQRIADVLTELGFPIEAADFQLPERDRGDLALPCFTLARRRGEAPPTLANAAAEALTNEASLKEIVTTAVAAGPYLNLWLNRSPLATDVLAAVRSGGATYGHERADRPERIVLEYVSPNTNKPLHLGHLRNACFGWSIGELLTAVGHDVIRAEVVNDRGVHIMKSLLAYERWGNGETPESTNMKSDHFVGTYYVRFAEELKEDPTLEEQVQEYLRRWEAGDEHIRALWQQLNSWAEDGIATTTDRIGIHFDRIDYESDIYEAGKEIILEQAQRGPVERTEDGALFIDLTAEGLDKKILLRADGTSVYVTQDVALAKRRLSEVKPDRLLYVVGQEQDFHFKVLFTILERFSIATPSQLHHISYHWVYLPEGRMKSREGTVVDADDLLDELRTMAAEEIQKRDPSLSLQEQRQRAETIALAAIKFYFLLARPQSDIRFNPEESLAFSGRTGPYLLYTLARTKSIFRKAEGDDAYDAPPQTISDPEWRLVREVARFPEVVRRAAASYDPSLIAEYAYDVARLMTDFYEGEPVLKAEPAARAWRLSVLSTAATTLTNALKILGIQPLERM